MLAMNIEISKPLKYNIFIKKIRSCYCLHKCGHEYNKINKTEESIEILKVLGLIINIENYEKICNQV